MGNEGHAQDSRPPPPHAPGDLFLTGKSDESCSVSQPHVAGGDGPGGGWGAGRGGA
jgi:hypothetical protein